VIETNDITQRLIPLINHCEAQNGEKAPLLLCESAMFRPGYHATNL